MRKIYVIAHNMRSTHNVGSLLRTAEGLGISKVFLTGYTPYPLQDNDSRLPHISAKITAQVQKTALGAEALVDWEYHEDISDVMSSLINQEVQIVALEQSPKAIPLPDFSSAKDIALLLGSEVTGIDNELLQKVQTHVVIPMFGKKESFNVVQAAAMAMYHLRFV